MRIKDGYKVVNMHGQNTVVYEKDGSDKLENTIVLTETAMFLWHMLDNFEISTVLALGDIDVFLRTMKENGVIED